MLIRSIFLSLLFVLTACVTSSKPIDVNENSPKQANIDATALQTLTLAEAKIKYGEPDLAEEVIVTSMTELTPYSQTESYKTLVNQLNSQQEVIFIHAIWQRYQHEIDSVYYQEVDKYSPVHVKVSALHQPQVEVK